MSGCVGYPKWLRFGEKRANKVKRGNQLEGIDQRRARLERMVRASRTRADFAEKFEALIESYNAGSRIEELFEELLKLAIEDTLDTGLPRAYTPELYKQKCSAGFEHVYESYPERGAGV